MLSNTEMLSDSTVKRLVVEQGRFLRVASFSETASYKFLY